MTDRSRKHPTVGRYGYVAAYQARRPAISAPQPRRIGRKLVSFVLMALFIFTGLHIVHSRHVSAHALAVQQAQAKADTARSQRLEGLGSQINQIITHNPQIDFSIAIQEIDSAHASTLHRYGLSTGWDAASTGKLITAADYLHHVAKGQTTLNLSIDGQTAQAWLQAMLVNSDDSAWEELNGYLGHNSLAGYADSIGITDYNVDANQLSAADIALVLQKLYEGQLLPMNSTNLVLGYLKQANYRQFIVPAVAGGDTVYHKIGLDNDAVNDAAIIKHGNQTLIIVIFTDGHGVYDWPARAAIMQELTRATTEAYFL